MRKLAVLSFVSLDGVMQAPSQPDEDTSGGFDAGGWANPWWASVMDDVQQTAMAAPYDLLLGRKTYELFAPHWSASSESSAAATRLNEATKYVVTSQALSVPWRHSVALSGDVVTQVQTLKQGEGTLLQVHGSWQLIQQLHQAKLIDEYRLWIFPVLLGRGKRLFAQDTAPLTLAPVSQTCLSNGVVRSFLRPHGD